MSAATSKPQPEERRALAAKVEAELAHRTRIDSKTWTEFERILFNWYEATKP